MIQAYNSLEELQEVHRLVLDPLTQSLNTALDKLEPYLLQLFLNDIKRSDFQGFGQILYYFSDLSLSSIQLFLQEASDQGTNIWDYRGYTTEAKEEAIAVNQAIKAYDEQVYQFFDFEFEEIIAHYEATGDWISSPDEQAIYTEELPDYLAMLIVPYFHKAYLKIPKDERWEYCYLDFYPNAAFLEAKAFDVEAGAWVEIARG